MKRWLMVVPLALVLLLLLVSGCAQRVREGEGIRLLTREVSLGKIHPGSIVESLTVSPDSKHFAYVARRGEKQFVVVDGEEGKEYDGIGEGTLIFSPDASIWLMWQAWRKAVCRSRWRGRQGIRWDCGRQSHIQSRQQAFGLCGRAWQKVSLS